MYNNTMTVGTLNSGTHDKHRSSLNHTLPTLNTHKHTNHIKQTNMKQRPLSRWTVQVMLVDLHVHVCTRTRTLGYMHTLIERFAALQEKNIGIFSDYMPTV